MRTLACLAVALASAAAADDVLIAGVWDANQYLVVRRDGGLSWTEAVTAAASDFGPSAHLVSITSAEENAAVGALVLDPAADPVWFVDEFNNALGPWLGAFQNDGDPLDDPFGPDQAWEWVTGEPWDYTNWAPGEPNNFMGEDYLSFFGPGALDGTVWNDLPEALGADLTGYVVEIECAADCNADGQLNILDFVCFQSQWQDQSFAGDCDANGQYNILDFVCFQGLFQAGCP